MAVTVITDERCTNYRKNGHPERPYRISATLRKLQNQSELKINWVTPTPATEEQLLLAHSAELINTVKNPVFDFDADTPAYPDIYEYATLSAGAAIVAAELAINGELSFSLMRPPGHHATSNRAMGFCYFNNIAIATNYLLNKGYQRAAVFDFDVHHGNGTEEILLNKPNVAFYSVHQYPHYPGTGAHHIGNNCFNYPVSPYSTRKQYLERLAEAISEVKKFNPSVLAVSAGFDAYKNDPLASGALEVEDYCWLGAEVRKLGVKTFCVLEGGYSRDLPDLIYAFLRGLSNET